MFHIHAHWVPFHFCCHITPPCFPNEATLEAESNYATSVAPCASLGALPAFSQHLEGPLSLSCHREHPQLVEAANWNMISGFLLLPIPRLYCVTTTHRLPTTPCSHARVPDLAHPVSITGIFSLNSCASLFSVSQQESGHSGRGARGQERSDGGLPGSIQFIH